MTWGVLLNNACSGDYLGDVLRSDNDYTRCLRDLGNRRMITLMLDISSITRPEDPLLSHTSLHLAARLNKNSIRWTVVFASQTQWKHRLQKFCKPHVENNTKVCRLGTGKAAVRHQSDSDVFCQDKSKGTTEYVLSLCKICKRKLHETQSRPHRGQMCPNSERSEDICVTKIRKGGLCPSYQSCVNIFKTFDGRKSFKGLSQWIRPFDQLLEAVQLVDMAYPKYQKLSLQTILKELYAIGGHLEIISLRVPLCRDGRCTLALHATIRTTNLVLCSAMEQSKVPW
ncbi:hypothetical protein EDD37DRAFT_450201 [Exophiala viscosa]|uniref:uncharacterized protein n=1 Tax=Exophiala viscosa TaxID=2486360 RepID=UPI002193BBAD|nr:hypothetical protein EDD37DRAFT_450201 [Exophiala viscosa]